MEILKGKPIAEKIAAQLAEETRRLKQQSITPGLAVILVGEDPASEIYVGKKESMCKELGFFSVKKKLPGDVSQEELDKVLEDLNQDPAIHGILCQFPLPKHLNEEKVILSIDPKKDVDCFHPFNLGVLMAGNPIFMPCTPYGVIQVMEHSKIETEGKEIVVVGRSNIVGRPLSVLLSLKGYDATVTVCHSRSNNLEEICSRADIVIVAIGKPEFLKSRHVKEGAVVIDVGINRVPSEDGKKSKIVGDADFEDLKNKVSAITPVPGGIGPLTIQMLMFNTVNAARDRYGLPKFELSS